MKIHPRDSQRVDMLVTKINACDSELQLYVHRRELQPEESMKKMAIRAKKEMLIVELKRAVQNWTTIPTYIEEIILSSTL
ncbi:GfV-C4-ORF1 [Ichnoviriform fumiferanae]|uniref:GfV-C4-ORF1 n=1 Tax=Ichnoviriform fumiferanae TaxID=419435 RepID=A2PZW5_9VIRU|nr:GfV-C4-ORF1 [Ichnoviriform fumiferanae]BAF45537.1 GfV-C4-ORF1 [Ichnoviriform fumiferanae]